MARTTRGARLLALAAGAAFLVVDARAADATFTVAVSGATTTITQTDTDTLIVTQMPDGALLVSDSGPLLAYPPTTNLVVRGAAATTPSMLFVVLDSPLPGSLMLDLPGASTATVRGSAASIGGALRVKGGAGRQIVRLGTAGETLTIERTATIDLGDGTDDLVLDHGGRVEGSLNVQGVTYFRAVGLSVDRSVSVDMQRELDWTELSTSGLVVGRSFRVLGGPSVDQIFIDGGTVGRSVTLDLGEASGSAYLFFDSIGGNVKASYGTSSSSNVFAHGHGVLKGSLALTMLGYGNDVHLDGVIEGTSIKYTGGPGQDDLALNTPAPRANATIDTGGGDDDVDAYADRLLLKRLKIDLGDGVDVFDLHGWVPPPGSTIAGLP